MNRFIKTLAIVLFIIAGIGVAGCRNTASGFGKDVENAGEKIQDKVN